MRSSLIYIALLLVCSCSQRSVLISDAPVTTITVEEPTDVAIEDVTSELNFVKLEAKENSMFGYITKVRVFEDKIYILDNITTKRIYIFDMNGKHLKTLDNQGRGPNEYLAIRNFELDYANRELIVGDDLGFKILIYDLDGNVKRSYPSKWLIEEIAQFPDKSIVYGRGPDTHLCHGDKEGLENKLIQVDTLGETLCLSFPDDVQMQIGLSLTNYLCSHPDETFSFAPPFQDTIYTVTMDRMQPDYALKFNMEHLSKEKVNAQTEHKALFAKEKQGITFFTGCHAQSDDYLYIQQGFTEKNRLFYDKKNQQVLFNTKNPLFGDDITFDEQGRIWASVSFVSLQFDLTDQQKQTSEFYKKLKANFTEEDNQPLIYYRLKQAQN